MEVDARVGEERTDGQGHMSNGRTEARALANSTSRDNLYELALPHIIESNRRMMQEAERGRSIQRTRHFRRLERFLHDKRAKLPPSVIAALEARVANGTGMTVYERVSAAQTARFRTKLLADCSALVRRRVQVSRVGQQMEELLTRAAERESKTARKRKGRSDDGPQEERKGRKATTKSTRASVELERKEGGRKGSKRGKKRHLTEQTSLSQEDQPAVYPQLEEDGMESDLLRSKLAGLEEDEARRLLWRHIARKQIPKVAKIALQSSATRLSNAKRMAQSAAQQVRRQYGRLGAKPIPTARRAMKEMLMFWKRNEREERDLRKRAEKEAAERRRVEEEQREARRQAKKLNFLITQTELYSHFVGKKQNVSGTLPGGKGSSSPISVSASTLPPASTSGFTRDTDFADVDDAVIQQEAERIAKDAAAAHQAKLRQFDSHRSGGADTDMDFMNPSTLRDATILEQPSLLQVTLKSYQLKGLTWLASLYEQGINGILADEMGLGKTVQSISLLAHLAERQNNWGPFIIVTPASTLHNWQQEFARFVPALRVIPYWGSVQDRRVLRSTCMSYWTGKRPVGRDTPFHVMITSYQLVVSDEAFLQKVKWQYMILDEAQAIKSSSSIRWRTLLGFKCRNRLLLTGTPIQNSMQELWALLHFIMPTLFDSHDEFSEWFSKDIESHAENRGGLNARQVHRLHMILKPFMLRRVKRDVENEMGEKVERDVICELSPRQRRLYRGIKDKLPLLELLGAAGGATPGLAPPSRSSASNSLNFNLAGGTLDSALMNLVMQFRKVCNHPELLERTVISSPLSFTDAHRGSNFPVAATALRTDPPAVVYRLPKRIVREVVDDADAAGGGGKARRVLLEMDMRAGLEHTAVRISTASTVSDIQLPCSNSALRTAAVLERQSPAAPVRVIARPPRLLVSQPESPGWSSGGNVASEMVSLLPPLHQNVCIPSMERIIRDSGKLSRLDALLRELQTGGHRVLLYNQMTRMIDLMEEYLQHRGYSYLRLDGSTNIATRRDLVHSWQTDASIFVFLLSTRAGGLGINLTAADTVIFYDSDWNPTVDQQAMDRAHRLGQTKQVTVYRLITRNTIEERIMQRAKQKDHIHRVVIAGGEFKSTDGGMQDEADAAAHDMDNDGAGPPKDPKELVSLLLFDEE